MTVGYELRTSLTIARGNLDLLRMRSGDAPEIAIALEELGVVEALVTSLLQRTGDEVDEQSLVPRRPALSRLLRSAALGRRVDLKPGRERGG